MSMRALRGLEMVCITKERDFDLEYAGQGAYTDAKGEVVKDLMDMGCVGCGASYYTRESSAIEFCPACGFMERKSFANFQELQEWSNSQDWRFLRRNGHAPYGVLRQEQWRLTFAQDKAALEQSGYYDEIHALLEQVAR